MTTEKSQVQFIENHLPSLQAGEYRVEVRQPIKIKNQIQETYQQTKTFYISSERFVLPLQHIHSVFPPENSDGEYSKILPHIVLNRSTLPWERNVGGDPKVPWLALLLFHEADELDDIIKINLKEARENKKFQFNDRFPAEPQEKDESLSILEIPEALINIIIPTPDDLKRLTHVRQVSQDSEKKNTELAVIIGNRLPQPGRNIAHLISLENYFQDNHPDRTQYFVSLKSWTFQCQSGYSENRFKQLLIHLNSDVLRRAKQEANEDAEKYLSQGYIPAIHHLRNSDRTISWYRGPLLPGHNPATLPSDIFPIYTPDRLLRYLTEIDMFDVSYAAAYQLGQLLALQDKYFSVRLYNWKRKIFRKTDRVASQNLAVMFDRELTAPSAHDTVPEEIKNWFKDVSLLKNIPFNYIISDLTMLPEESIRFFWRDNQWLKCFCDGAFGIGNQFSLDECQRPKYLEIQEQALNDKGDRIITGFLLRSILLSEFPALKITGFHNNQKNPLPLLRMENLSNTVLICLFEGEVRSVEISAGAEILHFGIDRDGERYIKTLRDKSKEPITLSDAIWRDKAHQILDVLQLSQQLLSNDSDASQFALAMVEDSPKVIFNLLVTVVIFVVLFC